MIRGPATRARDERSRLRGGVRGRVAPKSPRSSRVSRGSKCGGATRSSRSPACTSCKAKLEAARGILRHADHAHGGRARPRTAFPTTARRRLPRRRCDALALRSGASLRRASGLRQSLSCAVELFAALVARFRGGPQKGRGTTFTSPRRGFSRPPTQVSRSPGWTPKSAIGS